MLRKELNVTNMPGMVAKRHFILACMMLFSTVTHAQGGAGYTPAMGMSTSIAINGWRQDATFIPSGPPTTQMMCNVKKRSVAGVAEIIFVVSYYENESLIVESENFQSKFFFKLNFDGNAIIYADEEQFEGPSQWHVINFIDRKVDIRGANLDGFGSVKSTYQIRGGCR